MMKVALAFCLLIVCCLAVEKDEHFYTKPTGAKMNSIMPIKQAQIDECKAQGECPMRVASLGSVDCVDGLADEYPCENADLLSFTSLEDLGSQGDGNDIWGWTDPITNNEYALMCCEDGTSFVDVTDPTAPVVLGFLPTHTITSIWRDVKVYKNHAFIVAESLNHGMQVFDLTQLRDLDGGSIKTLEETAFYGEFGNCHNIVINEDTAFAYAVGTSTCQGGLHVVDISDPTNPEYAGCYWQDVYVHDAQCVIYDGPDQDATGDEICFCYNEDTLTVVNV